MKYLSAILFLSLLAACSSHSDDYDASGNFEADEVIVSSRQNGQLLSFTVNEGDSLLKDAVVGRVDVADITLQKAQVQASIAALRSKTTDPSPRLLLVKKQLAVQESQLEQQLKEKTRTENLLRADAATRKQLDDINAQVDQLQKQIQATRQQLAVEASNVSNQNRSVMSEKTPLEKSIAELDDRISKGLVVNPVTGVVLTRYAMQGEMTATGKPLYRIANTDTLLLRAYITGTQLPQVKTGQHVKVRIDAGSRNYKVYDGIISWIAAKSEFTPKTIQTKDERASLVYAIKVRVKNDGYLKIGMYGEVKL